MKKILFLCLLFILFLPGISFSCREDVSGDGVVNNNDFLILLGQFNKPCNTLDCPTDINEDGVTNNTDFLLLLGQFNHLCNDRVLGNTCAGDLHKNYTTSKTFDGYGAVVSETRAYSDYLGKTTQVQSRNLTTSNIIATQTIYDAYGRAVLQTLPAPIDINYTINLNYFCYKDNFISNTTNANYSYADFDVPNNTTNANALTAGEVDLPKPVSNTDARTLGWYYNYNNTAEPYVPASAYPYVRSQFDDINLGGIKRTALAGEGLKMGDGHESQAYTIPASYTELAMSGTYTSSMQFFKKISVDENGRDNIGFYDALGNLRQTCRTTQPGETADQSYSNPGSLNDVSPADIHMNVVNGNLHLNQFVQYPVTVNILNLKTNRYIVFSGNTIDFSGTDVVLPPGVYRVSYKSGIQGGLSFTYPVQYSDYTIYTYDKTNRLTYTIPPKAVSYQSPYSHNLNLATKYEYYSSLNWVSAITTPDEGRSQYLYRQDGSLRFSQNWLQLNSFAGQQLTSFTYYNYDRAGRIVETGEYRSSVTGSSGGYLNLFFESTSDYTPTSGNSVLTPSILNYISNMDAAGNDATKVLDPLKCFQQTFVFYDMADPDFTTLTGLPASGYTQDFLLGKVSKTKNGTATTWYSYDELGRMTWMVQRIEGMPELGTSSAYSVKTINYTYDFNGNILQVAYQREKSGEDFYHSYVYDIDNRLVSVYTSTDGINKEKQADYFYYLHGPVKRVELANKVQGIDYVYTINGWLKSINTPELNQRDPGVDGYGGMNKKPSAARDLFGMTLDYFGNDYSRNSTLVQTYGTESYNAANPNYQDLYNGMIRGQRWQTKTASSALSYLNQQLMYKYAYDKKYQLTDARFGTVPIPGNGNNIPGEYIPTEDDFTAFSESTDYKSWGLTYDPNGNIQTLNRNAYAAGTGGLNLDNMTYTYTDNSNKLASVSDNISSNTYADLNYTGGTTPYTYDYIGQMSSDLLNTYDHDIFGKVTAVKNKTSGALKVSFVYDDKGFRIKKTAYSGSTSIDTWYVRDASGNILSIYDNNVTGNALTQKENPVYGASRIGTYDMNNTPAKTIYELTDQLGNVRTTFSKTKDYTIATGFEGTGEDDYLFDMDASVDPTVNHTSGGTKSVKLNSADPFGPGISIPVTPGQIIDVSFFSKYTAAHADAMMVYEVHDKNNTQIFWGSAAVGTGDGTWQSSTLTHTIAATAAQLPVTFVMYPWNNDATATVWFDDLSITITPNGAGEGGIDKPVQESLTDYYPHGSPMPGRNFTNNRFQYQGQFAEKDAETNFNHFEYRDYDNKLGRWLSVDKAGQHESPYLAMGNDPVNRIDPDGLWDYYYNSTGVKLGTAGTPGNDRFFMKHSMGSYDFNGSKYIQVNSVETINGQIGQGNDGKLYNYGNETLAKYVSEGLQSVISPISFAWESRSAGTVGGYRKRFPTGRGLIGIDGLYYNRSEVGNYLWGAASAAQGFSLQETNAGAQIYSYITKRSRDQANEVKAFTSGFINLGRLLNGSIIGRINMGFGNFGRARYNLNQ